eukprot:NODE_2065_length_1522_cov_116.082916_g1552_i1.p1 GENE.NODE_2065_length_1522_cov_116.082916_g1552_i1~~NODE_2065_length_1522_cov_116.082916_g1552_i1.p1  ORF type:complete len:456 (+),score=24.68 NODE_2065_length_1522_cov_116.082916_g1552_i1:69-1436(+)
MPALLWVVLFAVLLHTSTAKDSIHSYADSLIKALPFHQRNYGLQLNDTGLATFLRRALVYKSELIRLENAVTRWACNGSFNVVVLGSSNAWGAQKGIASYIRDRFSNLLRTWLSAQWPKSRVFNLAMRGTPLVPIAACAHELLPSSVDLYIIDGVNQPYTDCLIPSLMAQPSQPAVISMSIRKADTQGPCSLDTAKRYNQDILLDLTGAIAEGIKSKTIHRNQMYFPLPDEHINGNQHALIAAIVAAILTKALEKRRVRPGTSSSELTKACRAIISEPPVLPPHRSCQAYSCWLRRQDINIGRPPLLSQTGWQSSPHGLRTFVLNQPYRLRFESPSPAEVGLVYVRTGTLPKQPKLLPAHVIFNGKAAQRIVVPAVVPGFDRTTVTMSKIGTVPAGPNTMTLVVPGRGGKKVNLKATADKQSGLFLFVGLVLLRINASAIPQVPSCPPWSGLWDF